MTNSSHFSLRKAAFLVPALCVASALTQSALGASLTWNVGTGDFYTASSWSPAQVPAAAGDDVTFAGGVETAQLNADASVRRFTVSSGAKTFQGMTTTRTLAVTGSSTFAPSVAASVTLDNLTLSKTGGGNMTINSGGSFTLANSGAYNHSNGALLVNASTSFSGSGSASFSRASGAVIQLGAPSVTLSFNSGVTTTIGSGNIVFASTAGTIANAGTLNLNGTATFSSGSGTLANTGTLNLGSVVTSMQSGSTINLTGGALNLSITGDSTAGGLAITTSGTISLASNPVLNVTSVDVTETSVFTILNAGSGTVAGQFSGLAENAVFTAGSQDYRINYLGSSVTLTAVPEPHQYAAAVGLGLIAFTAFRRSRKTA